MKNFSSSFKTGAGAAVLLLALPTIANSSTSLPTSNTQDVSNTVHKVSHSLAGSLNYSKAPSYKWGAQHKSNSSETTEWARNETRQTGYKWSATESELADSKTSGVYAGNASYNWGTQNFSEQAGYKWGFRSYADQAGYKWGFRSYADQAGYKWGFRSYADQAGYKWGFRSYADQAGYKWGFRSYADQAGYKWGFR